MTDRNNEWEKLKDAAAKRIRDAQAKGEKANPSDFLIIGTNYDKIEGWFKDAYKDLP